MAKISPGVHTFREVLEAADVDFDKAVTVEEESGPRVDHRRVLVGGLGFDNPDKVLVVPEDAEELEIRVDGKLEGKLSVEKGGEFRSARELGDEALLPHVDPDKPGVTRDAPKSELEF